MSWCYIALLTCCYRMQRKPERSEAMPKTACFRSFCMLMATILGAGPLSTARFLSLTWTASFFLGSIPPSHLVPLCSPIKELPFNPTSEMMLCFSSFIGGSSQETFKNWTLLTFFIRTSVMMLYFFLLALFYYYWKCLVCATRNSKAVSFTGERCPRTSSKTGRLRTEPLR